ncbi:MAG: RNA polymerase sigma factor, partial [Actinocrinis sp.]
FVEDHQLVWLKFAHLNVGSQAVAEQIIDEVTEQLEATWVQVLTEDSVERYALNLVKTAIVRWQSEHASTADFVPNAAFLRAMRAGRADFERLEESLGLYSAIAQLPERQYMVIVLRFVIGCSDRRTALLLGISVNTVRSHIHYARKRLAKLLNRPDPDTED